MAQIEFRTVLDPEHLPEIKPKTFTVLSVSVEPALLSISFSSLIYAGQNATSAGVLRLSILSPFTSTTCPHWSGTLPELEKILFIAVQQTQNHYFSSLFRQLKSSSVVTPPSHWLNWPLSSTIAGFFAWADVYVSLRSVAMPNFVTSVITPHAFVARIALSFVIFARWSQTHTVYVEPQVLDFVWSCSSPAVYTCITCVPCTRHKAIRPVVKLVKLPDEQ